MENPPFEDVFPIQDGDFPLLCLFTGGYDIILDSTLLEFPSRFETHTRLQHERSVSSWHALTKTHLFESYSLKTSSYDMISPNKNTDGI